MGLNVLICRTDIMGTTMDGFRPVVIEEGNIHIWRAPFLVGQSNNATISEFPFGVCTDRHTY